MTDPMEKLIAGALRDAGIAFTTESHRKTGRPHRPDDITLDFYLPDFDLYIEVKRFHSERVGQQMARAPNVIVAQGEAAVRFLADRIRGQ